MSRAKRGAKQDSIVVEGAMIDSQTLIHAINKPELTDADKPETDRAKAIHLVGLLPVVRVSAITWMEALRNIRDDERPKFEQLRERIQVLAPDEMVIEKAIELMRAKVKPWETKLCRACLHPADAHKCASCGHLISNDQRMHDYIIAATADLSTEVEILYTFDRKILALGAERLIRPRVLEPPHTAGALFDQKDRELKAQAKAAKGKP